MSFTALSTFHGEALTDVAWASSLLQSTLDCWLCALDENGLFHPFWDRHWRREDGEMRTIVSQCRLIANFAKGYEIFGESSYAEASMRGIQALGSYFCLQQGGYRWSVNSAGAEIDGEPDLYGHAFSIIALATAARAFRDSKFAELAFETTAYTLKTFVDGDKGLVWRNNDATLYEYSIRCQNPIMHLFEALMVLDGVDPTGFALKSARDVLAFVATLERFDDGRLVEFHNKDWKPLPVDHGGVVHIGHLFEWAFLLSEWHAITGDEAALQCGVSFLQAALDGGVDRDGGVFYSYTPDGTLLSRRKGLWHQCEAIRALHRYVHTHDFDLQNPLDNALLFYRRNFIDEENGGVFAEPFRRGERSSLHKGDEWKLDYHSLNMCVELMETL